MKMQYLLWLLIFVGIPLIIMRVFNHKVLWPHKRTMLLVSFFSLLYCTPWDHLAVYFGQWFFPKESTVGINLGLLPIEEYCFFIFVSMLICCFTLILRDKFRKKGWLKNV